MKIKFLLCLLLVTAFSSIHSDEPAFDIAARKIISSKLNANGDINAWDNEIEYAAERDPDTKRITCLFERGNNPQQVSSFYVPGFFFRDEFSDIFSRYLSAKVYNNVMCNGAQQIVVFMDDKNLESSVAKMLDTSIRKRYPRFEIYGNYGEAISICDSSSFEITLSKELIPSPQFSLDYTSKGYLVGIDVGGNAIKVVIMNGKDIVEKFSVATAKEKGGKYLRAQVIKCVEKAKETAHKNSSQISSVGLAFPSPIKSNADGSSKVVRLTDFEKHWGQDGLKKSFKDDYRAINDTINDISQMNIPQVAILNDADAFGIGEMYHRLWSGDTQDLYSPKIVLPIGGEPGYVKISKSTISALPHQGGHMIIDLAQDACVDPGCEHQGCYGGYVPACAIALRAKRLGLGIAGRNEIIIPSNLNDALSLLIDISRWLAAEAVQLHKITGAEEIILAGGICQGWTGLELIRFTNDTIEEKYPQYKDKINITLTSLDSPYGGAIGAAQYAQAIKPENSPAWNYEHRLPKITIGKNVLEKRFKNAKNFNNCILTSRELSDFMADKAYPWFQELAANNAVFLINDYASPQELQKDLEAAKYDSIIAIGAGTITDWGKFVGKHLKTSVISVPSALSGNGMFTEKAIFYLGDKDNRKRLSLVSGPPEESIIDIDFLHDLLHLKNIGAVSSERCMRAGAGDMVTIYPALLDWKLASSEGQEKIDHNIYLKAQKLLEIVTDNAHEIRDMTDLGLTILAETMAEASLLNMRYGSSRPKDGSEHLFADEMDRRLPCDSDRLHGEQVGVASIAMGYLYGSEYNPKAYLEIRNLVEALGLPTHPKQIGFTKEIFVQALQNIHTRPDKYTFFDKFNDKITSDMAEQTYDRIFGDKSDEIAEFTMDVSYYVSNSVKAMLEHLQNNVVGNIDSEKTKLLLDELIKTKQNGGRVIVNAAGRIGEVAIFFLQKLRALGFNVDDFKEITPEFLIGKNDLILTFSGSGKTYSVINNLKNIDFLHRTNALNRPIFSITASPHADCWQIGKPYQHIITLPGRSKEDCGQSLTEIAEYLPLSSTFEYSTVLYLEGLVEILARSTTDLNKKQITEIVTSVIWDTTVNCQNELKKRLHHNELVTADFVSSLMSAVKRDKRSQEPLSPVKKIYFFGLGQNNYVIRLFARRMQNIGFEVFVPGPRDIVSNPNPGDIAIFVSNSGARGQMIEKMIVANELGCSTVLVTAAPHSPLAALANLVIPITRRTTVSHTADIMVNSDECRNERAVKRGFEIASMFYLEGVSVSLMKILSVNEVDLRHIPKQFE
jgi:glycerol dehydrogenase-like iron-containing ADH family enzyme/D-arabinose 5-phosphate isomerase GutQ/predicted NBD/HSP70 family sugar kinase